MKNNYLILILFSLVLKVSLSFSAQHTVTYSGFTFSPDSISANVGDTIVFNLISIHSALEVSQSTWNANSNVSNGGFAVPFGGGMTVVNTAKTYYYVCQNHYSMGMKGRIFVTNPNGLKTISSVAPSLQISPNPVLTGATITTNLPSGKENQMRIFDMRGKCVYEKDNVSPVQYFDLSGLTSGTYFVAIKSDDLILEKKLVITK